MRSAIFLQAEVVDKDVASLMNKISVCKEMGWTFEQYEKTKSSDLRKLNNYFKWTGMKRQSIMEMKK